MSIDGNKIMNVAAAKVLYDDLRQRVNSKLETNLKGAANGLAELDSTGKVPANQLPSYVDDVLEFATLNNFPAIGEGGKIYIALDTNLTYRWSGSTYTVISSSLALGETESTAYRGDRGAIAYNHANNKGNAYSKGLYKIATNAEGHVINAQNVIKQDITNLGIPGTVPTKVSQLQNDSGFISSYTETDPTVPNWAKSPTKPTYTANEVGALPSSTIIPTKVSDLQNDSGFLTQHQDISGKADKSEIPTKVSDLQNDAGYLTSHQDISGKANVSDIPTKVSDLTNDTGFISSYTETDPTVPSWAKSVTKPSYTAQEVGALPSDTVIPTKTSDLTNDSGFITSYTETDPTVPAWAKAVNKPSYTAQEIGALPDSTVIPTKVSDLTNDAGYLTSHQDISGKADIEDIPIKFSDLINDMELEKPQIKISSSSAINADLDITDSLGNVLVRFYDGNIKTKNFDSGELVIPTKVSDLVDDSGHYTKPSGGIPASDLASGVIPNVPVQDVQVNGVSILNNNTADIPIATTSSLGIVKAAVSRGIGIATDGTLRVQCANDSIVKEGTNSYQPITPERQHMASFYGLAKAAGDTTQSVSSNAVGTYTEEAKTAIRLMFGAIGTADYAGASNAGVIFADASLNHGLQMRNGELRIRPAYTNDIKTGTNEYYPVVPSNAHTAAFYGLAKAAGDTTQAQSSNAIGTYTDDAKNAIKAMLDVGTLSETVTGSTPVITATTNHRYICGEVTSLNFTPCVSGMCDVRFTSGSTATALTVPNTVKWPGWFDPTSLETATIYEINIEDGIYGVVMTWPV